MNYRMVFYLIGKIMLVCGAVLILPLIVSWIYSEPTAVAFLITIGVFLLVGGICAFKRPAKKEMFAREGLLIVAVSWILFSLIGALPFYISGEIPSYIDCFFETVSGFTTTGSTILKNVEELSRSMLFWRSFTHWIGGMGILVFAMTILSQADTKTSHIMRAEMPGPKVGKLVSKWKFTVRILYSIYFVLSALEVVLLLCGGMPLFDSIVHTFGTAGTGGFGIKNSSIAYYNSAYIDYVIGIFMILFGMNFNVFYFLLIRRFVQAFKNEEILCYLGVIAVAVGCIAWNIRGLYGTFAEAFRFSFFQVSSIITTTGYATADFTAWPVFSQGILVLLMFIGGCAGSTAGGLKVIRITILWKTAARMVKKTLNPRSVVSVKNDGKMIEQNVVSGVGGYFIVYMLIFAASVLVVCLNGKDMVTSVTAVAATLNNVGPGLGTVGPNGNFADFSLLSKLVMSFDMLAGRLELFPILMLFSPGTWKKS